MTDCTITDELGVKWITITGRLDSITSPEIHRRIRELILGGQRTLVFDMGGVNYVSSAGLSVFVAARKQIHTVGGEIILYNPTESVLNVFRLSRMDSVFRIVSTRQEIESALRADEAASSLLSKESHGVSLSYVKTEAAPGDLHLFGSEEKLPFSKYQKNDVAAVKPNEVPFGLGLGTLGDRYEEYKQFFGEALILTRNLFFYPAVKRPAVDFMLCLQEDAQLEYKFLHGFGFNGAYKYVMSFESTDEPVELGRLVDVALEISDARLLGVVILAESKGLWGMNLKRVPILENRPPNGKAIFDTENFSEWMDFPVEPSNINNVIAGIGIIIRDVNSERPEIQELVAKGRNCHFHGVVLSKEPLSKRVEQFETELKRVLTELEARKVQHILGQTRFGSGMLGIIELNE